MGTMRADGSDDGLPTDVLFRRVVEAAVSETVDDHAYWDKIYPLQRKPPQEVWALVAPLASDPDPRLRALVPDVLRFLGGKERPLLDQTLLILKRMLQLETAALVISSIATAFVDLAHPAAVDLLRPFVAHPEADVRSAIVHGLLPVARSAVPELLALSRDDSADVRNWATFGLGSQLGDWGTPGFVDTREVREALAARLDDADAETRAEATLGLARRRDGRAVLVVARELQNGTEWPHYVEAAENLADARLYEALVAVSKTGRPPADLSVALAACHPERVKQG